MNTDEERHTESSQELEQLMDSRVKCCSNLAAAQMKVVSITPSTISCSVMITSTSVFRDGPFE